MAPVRADRAERRASLAAATSPSFVLIRMLAMILALAALLVAASPGGAAIHVPRTHRTLQAGIDAASPGDTVFVGAGIYKGPFTIKKNVVLFGTQGPDTTILDGGDATRVLMVEGVSSGGVVGFKIRGGRSNSGGGIHILGAKAFLVAGSIFEKNWESAVSIWQSEAVDVRDCRFIENQGSAITMTRSTGLIRSCEFLRNGGNSGGAIALYSSRLLYPMRGCNFEGNHADQANGGAVYADSSEAVIVEGWFEKNTAQNAGGAVAIVRGSRVSLSRSRLTENEAALSGAVHVDQAMLIAGLCVFDLNRSKGAAGAAMSILGRGPAGVNPTIQNNTFYRNSAPEGGATIWAAEQVSPDIVKNIFVMEPSQRAFTGIGRSTPSFECNLLYDPSGAALTSLPSTDTLVGDPLFCDEAKGDFYLKDLSPAVLASCGPIGALPKKCSSFKMVPSK